MATVIPLPDEPSPNLFANSVRADGLKQAPAHSPSFNRFTANSTGLAGRCETTKKIWAAPYQHSFEAIERRPALHEALIERPHWAGVAGARGIGLRS